MYYESGFDSCYEEIIRYYPVFYKEIFEMNEILKTYGSLADIIQKNIEIMLADNYIQTANEATITRLERFLYINTDKTKSLDERKKLVLSFFIGFGRISATKIKEIINNFTKASVDVRFEKFDEKGNSCLYIICDRGDEKNFRMYDILEVLMRKIPAHIFLNILFKYVFDSLENNKSYIGVKMRMRKRNVVFENGL